MDIDHSTIKNEIIAEAFPILQRVGKRQSLEVERWDNVLDKYPNTGTVSIPVRLGMRIFKEPFYFLIEKVNDQELLFVRPLLGEHWSIGDVYGFFGIHSFKDYIYGLPIIIVEGPADWAALRTHYKYVLCSLGAKMTVKQQFILANLTETVYLAYDTDQAGENAFKNAKKALLRHGVSVQRLTPTETDWGKMQEDDWGQDLIAKIMHPFKNLQQ